MADVYLDLVEKILREKGLLNKQIKSYADLKKFTTLKPFITIAREPGSGGRPIGKMVSRKLGFRFYNSELIHKMAKSAKKRASLFKAIDEKKQGFVIDLIKGIFEQESISEGTYMKHLLRVVYSLAIRGNSVILGRGVNFVIPSACALRVRIQAPYKIRVKRAAKFEKISYEEAKERVSRVTKERKEFIKEYYSKNINNSDYYDLVLNTKHMTLKDARDLIISAFKKKFPKGKFHKSFKRGDE